MYVLKLEEGKYYVGVTARNVTTRMEEHTNGFMGAKWTKRYKPIKILDKRFLGLKTFEEAERYETRVVMKYMDKYGVNNVRGGLLTYEGKYKYLFGRYLKDDDYEALRVICFLLFCLLVTTILFYTKK